MRKTQKTVIIGGTVAALCVGGAAFAYWSTSGSGTGTGSTETRNAAAVSITGDAAAAFYPGDSAQTVTATVKNNDADQSLRVAGVTAYVTTDKAGCDGSDYLLNGNTTSAASPATVAWTAKQLAAGASDTTTYTLQFNNKPAVNQDACSAAAVTVHYASN